MNTKQVIKQMEEEFDEKHTCNDSPFHYIECCEQVVRGEQSERLKNFIHSYTRTLLESFGKEIIGESEPALFSERNKVGDYKRISLMKLGRNNLRRIQRLKVKEIISSLEK